MSFEDIQTETYKFVDFQQADRTVLFNVITVERHDMNSNDVEMHATKEKSRSRGDSVLLVEEIIVK